MTILGQSEELVSRCVECDLAEPESLASLGGSAPGVVDGILSVIHLLTSSTPWLIVSTPISAEVNTKPKPLEPGCLQRLNRATREGWRPSCLRCRIEPVSEEEVL